MDGNTPVHSASMSNGLDSLKILLKFGANIN